jgi:hypothetical protein|tara:strand:+ start:1545 stop:1745 length:201 start_codon:yes stop_codon:yes gene_type:complete
MLNINYARPELNATHVYGIWETDEKSGTFRCPIIYTDDVQDMDETINQFKEIQESALELEAVLDGQ